MLVNGYTNRPADRQDLPVFNPADGSLVGTLWKAAPSDLDLILDAANRGYAGWSKKSVIERAEILLRFADALTENEQRIAVTFTKERGKTINESLGEIRMTAHAARGFAEMAKHLYRFKGDSSA